jgi:hypothetical protein
MRDVFETFNGMRKGRRPMMLTPSQQAIQDIQDGVKEAQKRLEHSELRRKHQAENKNKGAVPVLRPSDRTVLSQEGQGVPYGVQQTLKAQGRPDLADAWYTPKEGWDQILSENKDTYYTAPIRQNDQRDLTALVTQPQVAPPPPIPITTLGGLENEPTGGAMTTPNTRVDPYSIPKTPSVVAKTADGMKKAQRKPRDIAGKAKEWLQEKTGIVNENSQYVPGESLAMRLQHPEFDQGTDIRDEYIRRAALPPQKTTLVPNYADGGRIKKGKKAVVGRELVEVDHKGATVTPIEDIPRDADYQAVMQAAQREAEQNPMPDLPVDVGGEGSGRAVVPTEGLLSVGNTSPLEEGLPAGSAPRRDFENPMALKRWVQTDPNQTGSDQVWDAREDVVKEDLWQAANKPQEGSIWKSLGVGLMQLAKNRITKQNEPVVGWRDYKRNQEMEKLAPRLAVIQQEKARRQADQKAREEARVRDSVAAENYAQAQKQLADIEIEKAKDARAGEVWKEWVGDDGMLYKQTADGTLEPLTINGVHQKRIREATVMRTLDDGTPVGVTGSQALTSEDARKQADAQRQQDIIKFNANNRFEAEKKNVENFLKYQDDVKQIALKVAEIHGDAISNKPAIVTANAAMQAASIQLQNAANNSDAEAFTVAQEEFNKATERLAKALKTEQGAEATVQKLKEIQLKAPPKVTFKDVKAVQVSGTWTKAQFLARATQLRLSKEATERALADAESKGMIR